MASSKLIADSGATKAEWCLLENRRKKIIFTQGISPYFFNEEQIHNLLVKELCPKLKNARVDELHYYGTGMRNPKNVAMLKRSLNLVFPQAGIDINDDMVAAARGLAGKKKVIAAFSLFLSENRGHYMIENIIEDGLNDFFFIHLQGYKETSTLPVSFVGSIAYAFRDVLQELCQTYKFELGRVIKSPIEGLIDFHR